MEGLVYFAPGEDSHHFAVFHHREAFVPVTAHRLGSLGYGGIRREGVHTVRHYLRHGDGGFHVLAQEFYQAVSGLSEAHPLDEGGSSAVVSAAAHLVGDEAHVYGVNGAAGYHLDASVHFHQDEKGIGFEEVPQLVGQGGDFLHVSIGGGCGDDYRVAGEFVWIGIAQEAGVELLLLLGKGVMQEAVDHRQIRALLQ